MSNLVSRNKFPIFALLSILVILLNFSCRKKIDHVPASSDPVTRWRMVTNVGNTISSIEVFNNELYVAGLTYGQNYYIPILQKIGTNLRLKDFHYGFFSKVYTAGSWEDPHIYDLYATSDKLYIGGNFKFNINNATSLMCYNLNGSFNAIPLLTSGNYYVSSFCDFESALIVGGYFTTNDPLVHTANTERLQNDLPIGLGSFPDIVVSMTIHQDELFAIGKNRTLGKWNGSQWVVIGYSNPDNSDNLWDLCSFNNELYLAGKFDGGLGLKKLNALGIWEDVTEFISYYSSKLKVIDNKLYLYGSNIYFNGKNTSNIFSYNGSKWEPIGETGNTTVSGLVKFNGKLMCSIGSRIYAFE